MTSQKNVVSEFRPDAEVYPDPYNLNLLLFNDIIQYRCSCGQYKRLYSIYFCRHCMTLKCRTCVYNEVDSQYCQNCLEYIPTIDPKYQINKCASCYICPHCGHLLSTSFRSSLPADQQPQTANQLQCEFCRYSLNTIIADVIIPNSARISELVDFYKAISQKEKASTKKRRFHARTGNTLDLLKKYGIDNSLSPKLFETLRARTSPLSTKLNSEPTKDETIIEAFKPAQTRQPEQLKKLDTMYYYDKNFDIQKVCGIEQRLAQIELQPEKVDDLKPISKSLSVKRSLRCKDCERNLCRSEYSPLSIRFKIQSAAFYYVPELRLSSYPANLKLGEVNIVEFSIQNQTLSNVKVKFEQASVDEVDAELIDGSELVLPHYHLELGPKDDTADYEHMPRQLRPLNEETQIIFQSACKIGFYIKVKPKVRKDMLWIPFRISHDVLLMQNPKENERVQITHNVKVNLGPVE